MASVTVTSPNDAYDGTVVGVVFKHGKAKVDRANRVALGYFRRHGYTIGGVAAATEDPPPPDPRDIGTDGDGIEPVGTKLRDAAVDPRKGDFLAPTNAGDANPHGPEVVSPGVHAQPPSPIVPGPVSSDAAEQEAIETSVAEAALVEQQSIGGVVADAAAANPVPQNVTDAAVEQPAKSAAAAVWVAYGEAMGLDGAADMTKAQLLEHFGVE